MDYEESGSTDTLIVDDVHIPGYLTYVVIVYRLACAVFIIGMGSLIISTIVKTRALHNVHNILIVNLMVADMVEAVLTTFQTTGMMFSHIAGTIPDSFRCDVLIFFQFPLLVIIYTFIMLSLDKFIAIKFALRYNTIVTQRRAYLVIVIGWTIAMFISTVRLTYQLASGFEYDKSSQLGSCLLQQQSIWISLFTSIIPIIIACSITIALDSYLSIKAYQLYKKIQQENGEERKIFEDNLHKILQHLKPMITLLVIVLGNMTIALLAAIINLIITTLNINESVKMFTNHTMIYNIGYLTVIVHPVVYGLYFHEMRQSLCRRIKQMTQNCKFSAIEPSQASSSQ